MREVKAVVFDLDGTLTQSEEGIWNCVRHAVRCMGMEEPDAVTLRKFVGPPLVYSFQEYLGMTEEEAWQATDFYRQRYNTVGLFENRVYPGIRRVLARLKKAGYYLAVATGKPQRPTEQILAHFGLDKFFDMVAGTRPEDATAGKAGLISRVLPAEYASAVMVGDTHFDMEGAQAVGIDSIGVGYGYGGEGDWKVAAMTAILKAMGENGNGASAFMEDYTYHLVKGQEYSLGAHMLEVCPSVASGRPRIETHFLGIGMNEKDPARLVFEGKAGKGVVTSLIDMGGRLRLIVQDIEAVKPIMPMPNLPVARVMWRAIPDLTTGVECWITAGGAHHTVLSYDVTAEQLRDWARMMEIEFVHITKDTTVEGLEQELFLNDLAWKLKN